MKAYPKIKYQTRSKAISLFLVLVLSISFLAECSRAQHVITKELAGHHWSAGANPGMTLGINRQDVTIIRKYITHFLPKVLDP